MFISVLIHNVDVILLLPRVCLPVFRAFLLILSFFNTSCCFKKNGGTKTFSHRKNVDLFYLDFFLLLPRTIYCFFIHLLFFVLSFFFFLSYFFVNLSVMAEFLTVDHNKFSLD